MNARTNVNIYSERRAHAIARMNAAGGGIGIVATAPEVPRNADSDYQYRYDSYFYYLTGFEEPQSVVVLIAGDKPKQILFCREKNEEREIWDGYRYGPAAAREAFGFDEAYDITKLDEMMPQLIANQSAVHSFVGTSMDAKLAQWLGVIRGQVRAGKVAPQIFFDLRKILNEMRLIKDAHELDIMRAAGKISAGAHVRAMRKCKPGLREYHLEAELLHEFRMHGSEYPAYGSIVGTGANSCILHYRAGNTEIKDGDVVLIDAGCELQGYASDITRTFPANGKFSGPQKAIYELVLAAQEASIAQVKAGNRFSAYHDASTKTLAQGMIDLGLVKGSLDAVLESGSYKQFYMHRAGHWLGLDVHDCGDYADASATYVEGKERESRKLQAGMVLTVEPGLYVRPADNVDPKWWNIGVRIEDDIVVTAQGNENLTRGVPVTVAEIEALMRG
ncbi:MAG: aminopeptidase P N-terminal domain-containing protein [Burkholderiaceae bacterium]